MRRFWASFITPALLLLSCAGSHAVVLDWSTVAWAAGATSKSIDMNGDGTTDITVSFGGQLNTFTTQNSDGTGSMTPLVDSLLEGGQSPVRPSLDLAGNLHTNSNLTMTVTFSPQYTLAAQNVSFTIFGIDHQTNDDQVANIYA